VAIPECLSAVDGWHPQRRLRHFQGSGCDVRDDTHCACVDGHRKLRMSDASDQRTERQPAAEYNAGHTSGQYLLQQPKEVSLFERGCMAETDKRRNSETMQNMEFFFMTFKALQSGILTARC
jgi:hypothetical protein